MAYKYVVKCDDCKKYIKGTNSLRESAEGGVCLACRKKRRSKK